MSNFEIAKKIIKNYLERNKHKEAKDVLKEEFDIADLFIWQNTSEGQHFWSKINKKISTENFREFMLKNYFCRFKNFIFLNNYV